MMSAHLTSEDTYVQKQQEMCRRSIAKHLSERSLKQSDRRSSKELMDHESPPKNRDGMVKAGSFRVSSRKDPGRVHPEKSASFRVCRKDARRVVVPGNSFSSLEDKIPYPPEKCPSPGSAYRRQQDEQEDEGPQKVLKRRTSSRNRASPTQSQEEKCESPRSIVHPHRGRHSMRASGSSRGKGHDENTATQNKRVSRNEPRGEGVHRQSSRNDLKSEKRPSRSSKTEGGDERRTSNKDGHRKGKHRSSRNRPDRAHCSGDGPSSRHPHSDKERARRPQLSLDAHLDDKERPRRRSSLGETRSAKFSDIHSKRSTRDSLCEDKDIRDGNQRRNNDPDINNQLAQPSSAQEQDVFRLNKLHGTGAKYLMVDGVAPGYNLAKFVEEQEAGTIDKVSKSWRLLRGIPHYEEVAGVLVFTHLFEASPLAKTLFGFDQRMDPRSDEVRKSPAFLNHATSIIKMIEKALDLMTDLGPQSKQLPILLGDIGKKHSRMGVEESMLVVMGSALTESMHEMLGQRRFSRDMEKAFLSVYNVLAAEILHGMSTDKIVLSSWTKLKLIDDYRSKAGLLLFQHMFEHCPETKAVFGFPLDMEIDTETLKKSAAFKRHSAFLIMMFDRALQATESRGLHEQIVQLGSKHSGLGVKPVHYSYMGEALFHTLQVMLESDFDDKTRDAWLTTYARMSSQMISAMVTADDSPHREPSMMRREEAKTAQFEKSEKTGIIKKSAKLATKTAGKTLRAFSFLAKNAATSSAVATTTSYKKGKEKLRGTSTHEFMVDRDYDLAKFTEDSRAALASVNECWDQIKATPNYEEKAGLLLFSHLFDSSPMAKAVFGFPQGVDMHPDELKKNPFFLEHSASLIQVIERALNMLTSAGSGSSHLAAVLHDLGKKHSRMGVDESMFTMMGQSLIAAMQEMLGKKKFMLQMEKSWELVFNVLAAEMMSGMNTDKIVLASWSKLKTVEEWQAKAGLLLYQHLFEHCPETKVLFGFPVEMEIDTETLATNPAFKMHSEYFMMMFDKAMGMVQAQNLHEHMSALGLKHLGLGVQPEHFAHMGEALFHALETLLEDQFDKKTRAAWLDTYGRLSTQVMTAMDF